jgi:hypothetical protein
MTATGQPRASQPRPRGVCLPFRFSVNTDMLAFQPSAMAQEQTSFTAATNTLCHVRTKRVILVCHRPVELRPRPVRLWLSEFCESDRRPRHPVRADGPRTGRAAEQDARQLDQ